jgi:hypothetical protein
MVHERRIYLMIKILLLIILSLFSLTNVRAATFECPRTIKPNNPAKLEEITGQLPNDTAMTDANRLNATINTLRREGMPRGQIIDHHLIGAYCAMVVQQSTLTEAEKATRVRLFAGEVTRLVYSLESGLDIIVNVPLTPDVVDALNAAARKPGLSGPAWIAMTIENALQR